MRYFLILLITAGGLASRGSAATGEEPPHPWYGPASVQAPKSQPRRILLFTADWCGPCVQLKGGLIAELKRLKWKVGTGPENTIQLIDVDRNREIARRYKIEVIPTMIFIGRGDGLNLVRTDCLNFTPQSLAATWDNHYEKVTP